MQCAYAILKLHIADSTTLTFWGTIFDLYSPPRRPDQVRGQFTGYYTEARTNRCALIITQLIPQQ